MANQIITQQFPTLEPKFDNKVGVIEKFSNADEARRAFTVAGNRKGCVLVENGTLRDMRPRVAHLRYAAVMLP